MKRRAKKSTRKHHVLQERIMRAHRDLLEMTRTVMGPGQRKLAKDAIVHLNAALHLTHTKDG